MLIEGLTGGGVYMTIRDLIHDPIRPDLGRKNLAQGTFVMALLWPVATVGAMRSGATGWIVFPMIIGAGFIGCEVAASLRKLGAEVTIVEPQPAPLASVLGTQIGDLVARLHRAEGVDVRCGIGVAGVTGTDRVEKVQLNDGTELDADAVVVGIGSRPSTDWL